MSATFEAYVRDHLDRLSRFAAVLTADRALAEDVVQVVLERALRRWDRVSASDSPHAYVRRMVVNEFVSAHRRWGRVIPMADLDDLVPDVSDPADRHAESVVLLAQINQLPRKQRICVVLRYYEGLDDTEIASAMGCGPSTVRSNIARALATLRGAQRAMQRLEAP